MLFLSSRRNGAIGGIAPLLRLFGAIYSNLYAFSLFSLFSMNLLEEKRDAKNAL
jgi:hypothetical protein